METLKLNTPKSSVRKRRPLKDSKLRYGYIVICTDADTDGYSICAQLLNFFYKYWPELIQHEKILICNTPILQAKKGKEVLDFYSKEDYTLWESNQRNINSWKISYKKGLAALNDDSYKKMLQDPNITVVTEDLLAEQTLIDWFHKDFSDRRKEKIK